jgi:hypothetical protein
MSDSDLPHTVEEAAEHVHHGHSQHDTDQSETAEEAAEHVHHGHSHHAAHGAAHSGDTKVALTVTILAALLAVTEISGKGAQTKALVDNVTSNDIWAYYQAKSIRQTVVTTTADAFEDMKAGMPPVVADKIDSRIAALRSKAEHYESDPKANDGKKELEERAHETEHQRDEALAKYETLEYSGGAYELGIVLFSISMMTKAKLLIYAGATLGLLGIVLMVIGWTNPSLLEF